MPSSAQLKLGSRYQLAWSDAAGSCGLTELGKIGSEFSMSYVRAVATPDPWSSKSNSQVVLRIR